MKNDRQELILDIIANEAIETQEQLIDRLRARGVTSTQATISRDIKQLRLVKEPVGGGRYRYTAAQQTKPGFADRMRNILHESLLSVDYAQNIVVLKTMPGLANGAAAAFDTMDAPGCVGTLAGDDTVMIVMRDNSSAAEFCREIENMRK